MSGEGSVDPRTLKGFRDLFSAEVAARDGLVARVKTVFQRYGFPPLETPAVELLETLRGPGGEEINKSLFEFKSPEGEKVALRFDLTVPFARVVAQYPEKARLPFRRYQIGPVWRADKPDPGRYREFIQCDFDIAGSGSVMADAEVVSVICAAMRECGLGQGEFTVRVSDRRLVDAFLSAAGISDAGSRKGVLRVMDKLQKAGRENVLKELGAGRTDESGDRIRGLGLDAGVIGKVGAFIAVSGVNRKAVVEAVRPMLEGSTEGSAALAGMLELDAALAAAGVGEREAVFDPSLARGLDYYTGPVFEVVLAGAPEFGSVASGGRYDGLAGRFLGNPVPATGASVGLDRLAVALAKLGKLPASAAGPQAVVLAFPGVSAPDLLKVAGELRAGGVDTELYLPPAGTKGGMKDQLAYANQRGIPVAVMLGGDELANGTVSVKDLGAGASARADIKDREEYRKAGKSGQVTVSRSEMVKTVKGLLGK